MKKMLKSDFQFWSEYRSILELIGTDSQLNQIDGALIQSVELIASNLCGCLSTSDSLAQAISYLIQSYIFLNHSQRVTSLLILISSEPTTPASSILVSCYVLLFNGYEKPNFFITLRYLTISGSIIDPKFSSEDQGGNDPKTEDSKKTSEHPNSLSAISVLIGIGKRIAFITSSITKFEEYSSISSSNNDQTNLLDQSNPNPNSTENGDSPDQQLEGYSNSKLGLVLAGLLYELCRVQKLEPELLILFDEELINNLFELVELTRDHQDESFNYTLIKLIIALNEQFMIAGLHKKKGSHQNEPKDQKPPSSLSSADKQDLQNSNDGHHHSQDLPNIVIMIMKRRLGETKTFGENLIFILNRASHSTPEGLCVSLLILKILYLLFTTPGTHEYFYTNDLCVLVDVFIRELNDLPDDCEDLLHTYLRVLHPLLTNTQLRTYSYKRRETRHALLSLIKFAHLRELSPTTKRLVQRNLKADWCVELEKSNETLHELGQGSRLAWLPTRSLSSETMTSQISGGGSIPDVTNSTTTTLQQNSTSKSSTPSKLAIDSKLYREDPGPSHSAPISPNPYSEQVLGLSETTQSNPCEILQISRLKVQVTSAEPVPETNGEESGYRDFDDSGRTTDPERRGDEKVNSRFSSPTLIENPIPETLPTALGNSLRPGSSCSVSHSPVRRPAPKPPTMVMKRSNQLSTGVRVEGSLNGPLEDGQLDQPYVPKAPGRIEAERTVEGVSKFEGPARSNDKMNANNGEKVIRRAAPSPPVSLSMPSSSSNQNDERGSKNPNPRRRKAPLPPNQRPGSSSNGKDNNSHRSLRTTKSSVQLSETRSLDRVRISSQTYSTDQTNYQGSNLMIGQGLGGLGGGGVSLGSSSINSSRSNSDHHHLNGKVFKGQEEDFVGGCDVKKKVDEDDDFRDRNLFIDHHCLHNRGLVSLPSSIDSDNNNGDDDDDGNKFDPFSEDNV